MVSCAVLTALFYVHVCFAGQSLPPRSSSSTPVSQPGSMNTNMAFTSSPNSLPPPNPLSLMSQMSKYAIPSSTPLYHDAVKTIASSDDEMLPEQPLLAGVNIGGRKTRTDAQMKAAFRSCFTGLQNLTFLFISRKYGKPADLPGGPPQ